jgi:hypothetical protein
MTSGPVERSAHTAQYVGPWAKSEIGGEVVGCFIVRHISSTHAHLSMA